MLIMAPVSKPRVLVVEDDHELRDVLVRGLREAGFTVTAAVDGAAALRTPTETLDAAVIDIGLPDSDGRDVCQALRARGVTAPVVFLTARDGLTDRLSGFSAGGDDYLGKPFHFAELVARLRAALHRSGRDAGPVVDDLALDPVNHEMSVRGVVVSLTPTEFRILARLVSARGSVVRRHQLLATGWPDGAMVADNTLDQYAARVRRKLRDVGSTLELETARGLGYRLR
ncbi:two-component system, OmpR family, response regulator MprA [Actinopolymorpha cephalotaxi]|uniref:Two-component system, OmpR family, response regulator MprA n=1 Tax=Actinopolymorpha cephalotaxi TaxID=504797 RepID=A0A1I2WSJ9_9ACTN|nr:two-component system, OmpR family, response regulator MprA [Actinopolymorpha cephalotaxi]